jgi:DNA replication protein DnaC
MQHFCQLCSREMVINDAKLTSRVREAIEEIDSSKRFLAQGIFDSCVAKWMPMIAHDQCIAQREQMLQTDAQKMILSNREKRWVKACPPAYRATDYSKLLFNQKKEALDHVAQGGSALLNGSTGTGKTRLAWLMVRAPFMRGKSVHFWSHISLSKHFAAEAMKSAQWLSLALNKVSSCDILVLDDLGKARMTNADGQSLQNEEMIFELLDRRLAHQRQTIITTNDTGQSLEARMTSDKGAPLIRRIRDLCTTFNG